jgi:glycosyltransferase involved in cell wall biosynthesis
MRMVFIDSWFQDIVAGSGTAAGIGGLHRALLQLGHEVLRLAPASDFPANLTLRRLLFNLRLPARLRRERYDVAVGFDIDGFRWANVRDGRPYLVSVKGVIAEEMQHEGGRVRLLFEGLSRLERGNARSADGVLTTSRYCRDAIVWRYGVRPDAIRIVPEGIDLASFRIPWREPGGRTILCVARQYPRKHVADLLRALAYVQPLLPDAQTVVVGDGPEHENLRRLSRRLGLGDRVILAGSLSDEEVRNAYRDASLFCLPSVQEGFGIVFLEAMAAGLPVVASRSAAVPEVVPDGKAGILVPPGDVRALAKALIDLLTDPERRREMSETGRRHVEQFDWQEVAGVFLREVNELTAD